MNHPSITDLAELTPTSDPGVLAHVRTCADCRELAILSGVDDEVLDRPAGRPPADEPTADGYTDIAEIERGGMGRVLVARHRDLGREVLLKSMLPSDTYRTETQRARLRRRFEREVRLTARLQHPGIVPVYEAGRFDDGEPYYAMPRIAGRSLSAEIATRTSAADRLALVPAVIAACEAIAYAHDRGVVHRDLKPDNVLVGAFGETVVIDWGLARVVDDPDDDHELADAEPSTADAESVGDGLTRLGIGTAAYMPPEQVRGEIPDARADVYALGATLFHVLTGQPPHEGAGATAIRRDKLARAAPLELPADIPPALRAIVLRATAAERSERFPSALELAAELRRFQTGQLTRTHRYSARELLSHFVRRHRAAVRIAAAAVLVLAALAIVGTWRIARERDRAEASKQRALVELDRARGATALALAHEPLHRLEAVIQGVLAVGAPLARGEPIHPDASRGLLAALSSGPAAVELAGGAGGVGRLAAFADGKRVAVSGADGSVQIYDLAPARLSSSHVVGIGYIWGLHLSPDQGWLGIHGQPGYAVMLELSSGRQVTTGDTHDSIPCGASPSSGPWTVARCAPSRSAARRRWRARVVTWWRSATSTATWWCGAATPCAACSSCRRRLPGWPSTPPDAWWSPITAARCGACPPIRPTPPRPSSSSPTRHASSRPRGCRRRGAGS
jgi:serine/threonine protein kinase